MRLRPRQKVFVERSLAALSKHGNTLGVAPTGCHAPGTLILMHDGSVRPVEDIAVGDVLMGPGSTPRHVLELHRGRDQMFEVRPLKGDPFVVNLGHILTLVRTNEGHNKRGTNREGQLVDISIADWLAASDHFRHLHKLLRMPVDFPERETPDLDPYMLGVILGDGSIIRNVSITTPDVEIVDALYKFAAGQSLRLRCEQLPDNAANTYFFVDDRDHHNALIDQLRKLGLYGRTTGEKFLPDAYRLGSRDVRHAILAGLLDTDGHLVNGRCFEFVSKSSRLARDVVFVARSLGFLATSAEKEVRGNIYTRVHISGDLDLIPTRVLRKQAPPRKQKKNVLRCGFTVHPVGEGEYHGFTVDGDHRYLMGDFTLTHNSGKTIMLSAVAGEMVAGGAKACVLAHRDELTAQNREKFGRVNPSITTSVVDAATKDWSGQVTFAMAPTLSRASNLATMPKLDLLVIDEAHHAVADSYRRIVDRVRDTNPEARIFGVTATPNRGDRKGLREVFDNVADQVRLGELIASGHLVPPRSFVIDVGVQEQLQKVRKTALDFDMNEVADIMDRAPVTDEVIRHWREKAAGRPTIVFCSTVAHAAHVAEAFNAAGIPAGLIHGELSADERRNILAAYASGEIAVLVNVSVLTEGFDHPPTSCVVLLRPSSCKSTMIQMVGRGLRTVDPEEHPGIVKTDCVVLDFGTSSLTHGTLEQDVDLDGRDPTPCVAPTKTCPECEATVPLAARQCPICGYEFLSDGAPPLESVVMTEIDLLKRSSFQWVDLFGDEAALMATGFTAWGGIFWLDGLWYAVGGRRGAQPRLLGIGERAVCLAQADDWLNAHESDESAFKTRAWLRQAPTEKQLQYLSPEQRQDYGLTRYHASALISFRFNKRAIRQLVKAAATPERRAA
ncbi:ATP-dependent RNA helicase DbpA [Pseudoruegeria aquimaris]|uniref:ATP-dependent RNA helicase DbpA n=1 Tax=Pseudoruegeria aquimaris TaxID=393663 RepID=A0A1Y5RRB6_9RHOB|nr:Hint domain-containing homing endonuclease [Pseudoruegeria aquimaris]SLN20686.1 ATP-dependent RNA helicase DbpA [Pseudoruegeria aquimaris]